jgi:hypothetical protein
MAARLHYSQRERAAGSLEEAKVGKLFQENLIKKIKKKI